MKLFKAGDVVIAKRTIHFCDGTMHRKGQRIVIAENEVDYFDVCHADYHLISRT